MPPADENKVADADLMPAPPPPATTLSQNSDPPTPDSTPETAPSDISSEPQLSQPESLPMGEPETQPAGHNGLGELEVPGDDDFQEASEDSKWQLLFAKRNQICQLFHSSCVVRKILSPGGRLVQSIWSTFCLFNTYELRNYPIFQHVLQKKKT